MRAHRWSALVVVGASLSLVMCQSRDGSNASCVTCGIVVTELPALGARDGPLAIVDLETRAAVNRAGDIVLKSNYPSALPVLDREGDLLRTIGQFGSGPGDLRDVGSVAFDAHDSLFVFEWGNGRVSVFSPSYEFVKSVRLPIQPELHSLVLPNGDFLFNATIADSAAFGQPLQLVGRDGRLERSFGSEDPEALRGVPFATSRSLAGTADGLVWTASPAQYVVELWNPETGALVRRFTRHSEWFPPRVTVVPRDAQPPAEPQPMIHGLRHDAANRAVWVLLGVADSQWTQVVGPRGGDHGNVSVSDEQGYYDTLIEVLDDSTGELLARVRLPEYFRQFFGADQVGGVIEDDDAIPYFVRRRLRFTRSDDQPDP